MTTTNKTDTVFEICAKMLSASPEKSLARLNGALRSTLRNCIEADMPFCKDTFERIYRNLRGAYWFGDGAGSHVGEDFYIAACKVNHPSAQQSFEEFAQRPAVLWEEDKDAPIRLHVGARFTWKGHFVTITSMRKDSLVACSYDDTQGEYDTRSGEAFKIGNTIGYFPKHLITDCKTEGTATILHLVKQKDYSSKISKRFTISYEEISTIRKTAKARVKAMLAKIASCDPEKDRDSIIKEVTQANFRHFELEKINAAFHNRKNLLASNDKIQNWRNGLGGNFIGTESICLRIKNDRVECSNGNSVSLSAAIRVLPILLEQRKKKSIRLNIPVDSYEIEQLSEKGVKIGCTLVPWPEIELITPHLTNAD